MKKNQVALEFEKYRLDLAVKEITGYQMAMAIMKQTHYEF